MSEPTLVEPRAARGAERPVEAPPPLSPSLALEPTACCICGHRDAIPLAVGEDFEYHVSAGPATWPCDAGSAGSSTCSSAPRCRSSAGSTHPPITLSISRARSSALPTESVAGWRLAGCCRGAGSCRAVAGFSTWAAATASTSVCCRNTGHATGSSKAWTRAQWAVQAGRARGLRIHLGTAQNADLPAETYDLALLIATIEHVDDPHERPEGRPSAAQARWPGTYRYRQHRYS